MVHSRFAIRNICLIFIFSIWNHVDVLWADQNNKLILTQENIGQYHVKTIYDLLNQISGIKASSSSISIRGSSKVKVFLDGRSINDPTSNHGGIRWDVVDLDSVEKISIMRGKGGVEYGDNASGGIVDITMKKIDRFQTNLDLNAGNHQYRAMKAGSSGQSGNMGLGVRVGASTTDGFRINHDKKKRQIESKISYDFDSSAKVNAAFFYWNEDRGNSGIPSYPTPHSRSYNEMASTILRMDYQRIKSKTFVHWGNKETRDPDRHLDTYLTVLEMGQELGMTIEPDRVGKFNTGLGVEYTDARASQFEEHAEEKIFAFISKSVSMNFFPVLLDVGLRGIYYSEYDNALNPEINLKYTKNTFSGKLSVSRSSNAPSASKKYRQTSSTLPNPDLTIEKATNIALTFAMAPFDTVSLSLSPFYNIIDDRITYVRGERGIGKYENFGQVTYRGIDAGFGYKPFSGIDLKSSYTYLEAKDEHSGLWLSAKPHHRWINTITSSPIDALSLSLTAKASSSAYTKSDNTQKVPGYLVWNLRGEYRVDKIIFHSEINNLFDTDYFKGDGYQAAPFTLVFGIKYTF